MVRGARRVSAGQAAFWGALGLTVLLFLVFALRDDLGWSWLLAGALLGVFLLGWALLYVVNRFRRQSGASPD